MSRILAVAAVLALGSVACEREPATPNVILCMSDDQGWGDAGYQGHSRLRTPHLDALARRGVRFDRFYVSPMCTPTRAGMLTGRNPARLGIFTTGLESLPREETTIAEVLGERGWATGHFGKWHLGPLSVSHSDRRSYSPPWDHGFEVCFSTEASVPTWNPLLDPETGEDFGSRYWEGPDRSVGEDLSGDDSRVVMDRVVQFVHQAVSEERPFLAVVWLHAPHRPVVAGPDWRRAYGDATEDEGHYWGSLSAMDAEIGRLQATLDELGVRDDTIFFFCSDNGPALNPRRWVSPGSGGPFRGGKGGLHEGGIRVPAILDGPGMHGEGAVITAPTSVLDVFPTVLAVLGVTTDDLPPIDGIDLRKFSGGAVPERPWPIAFQTRQAHALVEGRYKLLSEDGGNAVRLFDVVGDPFEASDIGVEKPDLVRAMFEKLDQWRVSCAHSRGGADYRPKSPQR